MEKEDQVTICFVGTAELKRRLEVWAKEDERSVSYVMRDILRRETERRIQTVIVQNTPTSEATLK